MITNRNNEEWLRYGLKLGYYLTSPNGNTTAVYLTAKNSECFICEDWKTKKQYLSFGWIDKTIYPKWKSSIKEPNRIGTFTARKVADWMQYIDAIRAAYVEQYERESSTHEKTVRTLLDAGFERLKYANGEQYAKLKDHVYMCVKVNKDGSTYRSIEIPYDEKEALYKEFGIEEITK